MNLDFASSYNLADGPFTMISDFVEISDCPTMKERGQVFHSSCPQGIFLLPDNFETAKPDEALRYPPDTPTLRKILLTAGVPLGEFSESPKPTYVVNRSAAWIAPVLFIPAMILISNPAIVSIALNVVSNYITDALKGLSGPKHIKFEVVIERKGGRTYKRIKYNGDPEDIPELSDLIKKLADE